MIHFAIGSAIALAIILLTSEVFLAMLMLAHFTQLNQDDKVYAETPVTWRQRVYRKYLRPGTTLTLLILNTLVLTPGSAALIIYLISQL